jgi:hypothetical protein
MWARRVIRNRASSLFRLRSGEAPVADSKTPPEWRMLALSRRERSSRERCKLDAAADT